MTRRFELLQDLIGTDYKKGKIISLKPQCKYVQYTVRVGDIENNAHYIVEEYDPATRPDLWKEIKRTYKVLETTIFEGRILPKSVLRLKDGVVFSVGDRVNNPTCSSFIIKKFHIAEKDKLFVYAEDDSFYHDFRYLEKTLTIDWDSETEEFSIVGEKDTTVKDTITTETAIGTVEAAKLYFIYSNYSIASSDSVVSQIQFQVIKVTDTKEEAEEWVKRNKPIYSLKDIEKAYGETNILLNYKITFEELITSLENPNLNE